MKYECVRLGRRGALLNDIWPSSTEGIIKWNWPHCRNIFIGDRRLVFRELNTDEEPVAAHISRPPDSVGFLEGTHSRAGKRK